MAKQPNKSNRFPRHIRKSLKKEVYDLPCDVCDHGTMRLMWSNLYEKLFYGCDLYPTCSYSFGATKNGAPLPGVDDRPAPTTSQPLRKTKPCVCGGQLRPRWSHANKAWFYGCSQYPNCKQTAPMDSVLWDFLMQEEETPPEPPKKVPKPRGRKNLQIAALLDEDYLIFP